MARRIVEIELIDGKRYRFAEIPTSASLAQHFVAAAEGESESAKLSSKAMLRAMFLSLTLAGYDEAAREEIGWLIDLEDEEVVSAITRAMFSATLLRGGSDVGSAVGAVQPCVGNDAARVGGGNRGGECGDVGVGGGVPAGVGGSVARAGNLSVDACGEGGGAGKQT